jgi:hypothetical protein
VGLAWGHSKELCHTTSFYCPVFMGFGQCCYVISYGFGHLLTKLEPLVPAISVVSGRHGRENVKRGIFTIVSVKFVWFFIS